MAVAMRPDLFSAPVQRRAIDGNTAASIATSTALPGPAADDTQRAAPGGLDLRLPEQTEVSNVIAEFRAAIERSDRDAAEWAWMRAPTEDRQAWGQSPSAGRELFAVRRTLGVGMVHVMAQAGLDFAGRDALVAEIVAGPQLGQYVDAMFHQSDSLAASFLIHLPPHGELTGADKRALGRIITGASSVDAARFAFGRLHGGNPLDASYEPETLHTRAWTQEALEGVHLILIAHDGQEHIRSVTSWYIGYEYKEEADQPDFEPLGFAWYSQGRVVLPEGSLATGGGSTHSMVGGSNAHTDPGQTKNKSPGSLTHLQVSVLHEVGHGVGDALGGHAWARSHPFVGWQTGMDPDAWSAALWGDDDALTEASRIKVPAEDLPASRDVRIYMATSLRGAAVLPPGWDKLRMEGLIGLCYADQPLTRYWKAALMDRDNSFKFAGSQNYGQDGRVYVWLSRGNSGLASYTQAAHKSKVSWYSLASPNEWFAEEYVAYYHNQPRGTGLDAGTRAKLDELHARRAPVQDSEIMKPDSLEGQAAGASASGGDADRAAAPATSRPRADRVPLPW